jgi:hypothetical protein
MGSSKHGYRSYRCVPRARVCVLSPVWPHPPLGVSSHSEGRLRRPFAAWRHIWATLRSASRLMRTRLVRMERVRLQRTWDWWVEIWAASALGRRRRQQQREQEKLRQGRAEVVAADRADRWAAWDAKAATHSAAMAERCKAEAANERLRCLRSSRRAKTAELQATAREAEARRRGRAEEESVRLEKQNQSSRARVDEAYRLEALQAARQEARHEARAAAEARAREHEHAVQELVVDAMVEIKARGAAVTALRHNKSPAIRRQTATGWHARQLTGQRGVEQRLEQHTRKLKSERLHWRRYATGLVHTG